MKVAIIGANGYLGKHLTHYLNASQLTKTVGFDLEPVSCFDSQEYYSLDVTSREAFAKLDLNYDQIYFFSGLTGTTGSLDRYSNFIDVNEKGLLNLLDAVKCQGVKPKIIYPSTRLVYKGVEDTPLHEESEKEFKTIYASSKYNGELYLKMHRLYYDIDFSVFRICVPYGNLFDAKFSYGTLGFFISQASKGQPIQLYGDGSLKRTFTYVEDICNQIVRASNHAGSSGQTYNVGGEAFSLARVANLVADKHGVAVTYVPWPEMALKSESGDTIFDSSKIEQLIDNPAPTRLRDWFENQVLTQ